MTTDADLITAFTNKAVSKEGVYLLPSVNGGRTAAKYTGQSDSPEGVMAHMVHQQKLVAEGELSVIDETLVAQATTLDAMFNHIARLAHVNSGSLEKFEKLTRLALKAQQQSTNTLRALSEHKQPRSYVLAQQANIAQGHQQVNNGAKEEGAAPSRTHAHTENQKSENELLGEVHHERMDTGTQEATVGINQEVEAVDKINRS